MRPWGVWDTQDELWIGNAEGPLSYGSEDVAMVAARVADPILGFAPGRCRARRLPIASTWRHRDDLPTRMTPEQAIAGLEEGTIL